MGLQETKSFFTACFNVQPQGKSESKLQRSPLLTPVKTAKITEVTENADKDGERGTLVH